MHEFISKITAFPFIWSLSSLPVVALVERVDFRSFLVERFLVEFRLSKFCVCVYIYIDVVWVEFLVNRGTELMCVGCVNVFQNGADFLNE